MRQFQYGSHVDWHGPHDGHRSMRWHAKDSACVHVVALSWSSMHNEQAPVALLSARVGVGAHSKGVDLDLAGGRPDRRALPPRGRQDLALVTAAAGLKVPVGPRVVPGTA
jgi:hypothetical protein